MTQTPKRWTEEKIAERLFYLIERIDELEGRIKALEDNGDEVEDREPETVAKILHVHHLGHGQKK